MNRRRSLFIISIILIHSLVYGQINSPVQILYDYHNTIADISLDGNRYVTTDSQFQKFAQCLIRNNRGLFVALNGSGRLYQAVRQNNKLAFMRIDSTPYFGSNFGSFIFSYRDTIFSLGGYGFWKTNGLLRYFVEKRHEWEIIKLNKEIPVLTGNTYDLIWYDQAHGKMYFGFTRQSNNVTTDATAGKELHFETYLLDLVKKEWQQLGRLAPLFKNDLNSIRNITSSPFGQMIAFHDRNLFLDYARNTVYRLTDEKQRQLEQLPTTTGDEHVNYFTDTIFNSWLTAKALYDSLPISYNDLVPTNEKIYEPTLVEEQNIPSKRSVFGNPYFLVSTGFIFGVSLFSLFYYKRRRPHKKVNTKTKEAFPSQPNDPQVYPFSPIEVETIKTVYENSIKGLFTSIEELNKVLGVSKKSIEIQKKQRSDVISSINKKYSFVSRSQNELIEKRRTESDKRSFEYFIDHSRLTEARKFTSALVN